MKGSITVAIDKDILDLAERFLSNRRGQTKGWRKAVAEGNIEFLRRVGHELRGTAGAFGFQRLYTLAIELEKAVADGDLAATEDGLERMVDFLDRAVVVPG